MSPSDELFWPAYENFALNYREKSLGAKPFGKKALSFSRCLWGRKRGERVKNVTVLAQNESAWVDQARLAMLQAHLGSRGAEELLCRNIRELGDLLARMNDAFVQSNHAEIQYGVADMLRICDQIGLTGLGLVATDVGHCANSGDSVALAATMARLMRIGDRSLSELCELQINDF